jgi:hypothetical protein
MKYKSFLIAGLTACSASCGSETPVQNVVEDSTHTTLPADSAQPLFPDLSDRTSLTFPFTINNDNYHHYDHIKGEPLSQDEFDAMGLDILEDCPLEYGCNFYILHHVPFESEFMTWLVYRNSGAEWKMWLVNYDQNNQLIDHLAILYGDAVEYMSEIYSHVSRDEIELTEIVYDYSGETEKAVKEVVLYNLDEDGRFIKTNLLERSAY